MTHRSSCVTCRSPCPLGIAWPLSAALSGGSPSLRPASLMLSRLALRCQKRFTPTSRLLAESETARAFEVVLRRPSTTAHRGVKAGPVDVGVLPPYPANLR